MSESEPIKDEFWYVIVLTGNRRRLICVKHASAMDIPPLDSCMWWAEANLEPGRSGLCSGTSPLRAAAEEAHWLAQFLGESVLEVHSLDDPDRTELLSAVLEERAACLAIAEAQQKRMHDSSVAAHSDRTENAYELAGQYDRAEQACEDVARQIKARGSAR